MANCPWSHAEKGPCRLAAGHGDDHAFGPADHPSSSIRAAAALRHVASMLDGTLKAYQSARETASEEGTAIAADVDERIITHLVSADCLLRTQAALRAARDARRPTSGLHCGLARSDGDPR
jgi:hypothetical protein